MKHQSTTIIQQKTLKKEAKRKAFEANCNETDRKSFWNICKAISDLKRKEHEDQKNKTSVYQENLFTKNRWTFSKQVCNGSFCREAIQPTFTKRTCRSILSKHIQYSENTRLREITMVP